MSSKHRSDIVGYHFLVEIEKGESWGFIARCPGLGGVFVEAATPDEAARLAGEAACAILESRATRGDLPTVDTEGLRIIRRKPTPVSVFRPAVHRNTYTGACLVSA